MAKYDFSIMSPEKFEKEQEKYKTKYNTSYTEINDCIATRVLAPMGSCDCFERISGKVFISSDRKHYFVTDKHFQTGVVAYIHQGRLYIWAIEKIYQMDCLEQKLPANERMSPPFEEYYDRGPGAEGEKDSVVIVVKENSLQLLESYTETHFSREHIYIKKYPELIVCAACEVVLSTGFFNFDLSFKNR